MIRELLRRNPGLKLASLVIAYVLWAWAVGQGPAIRQFAVPLQVQPPSDDFLVIDVRPSEVRVRVEGDPTTVRGIEAGEVYARHPLHLTGARPDDGQMYTMKGIVLRALHRNDEAIAALREALRHPPVFALTHLNLGRALVDKHELAAAATQFRLAIRKDPRNLAAYVALAQVQMQRGQRKQAAATLDRAIAQAREAGKQRQARRLEALRKRLAP